MCEPLNEQELNQASKLVEAVCGSASFEILKDFLKISKEIDIAYAYPDRPAGLSVCAILLYEYFVKWQHEIGKIGSIPMPEVMKNRLSLKSENDEFLWRCEKELKKTEKDKN